MWELSGQRWIWLDLGLKGAVRLSGKVFGPAVEAERRRVLQDISFSRP
jgi:hypothetical protein